MGDARFDVAAACSRRIFESLGVTPEAVTPERLAKVIYAVLDAIYASESRLALAKPLGEARLRKGVGGKGSVSGE
jgi:hypothetical protein